jgi:hypothetical protein
MDVRAEIADRPALAGVSVLVALGFGRIVARLIGLWTLVGVVLACVFAFAVGIIVLRAMLLH